jgi:copper chaperone
MNDTITTTTFTITGMTCSHCVNAVTEEICKLDGVTGVHVDLATGTATIDSNQQIDPAAIAAAVDEAGYEVVS